MPVIDNLIAYYRLEEASGNAVDAHSGAHHMTQVGAIASAAGRVGNGRDFEQGDEDYFEIASYAAIQFGDTTWSGMAWIKRESTVSGFTAVILSKDIDTPASARDFNLQIQDDDSKPRFQLAGTGAANLAWGSALTDTASFHLIAFGYNGTSDEAWLSVDNGTPVTASVNAANLHASASSPFRIGSMAYTGFGPFGFDGVIDEVALWARDIRADLTWLYNSGNGRSYADIVAEGGGAPTLTLVGRAVLDYD